MQYLQDWVRKLQLHLYYVRSCASLPDWMPSRGGNVHLQSFPNTWLPWFYSSEEKQPSQQVQTEGLHEMILIADYFFGHLSWGPIFIWVLVRLAFIWLSCIFILINAHVFPWGRTVSSGIWIHAFLNCCNQSRKLDDNHCIWFFYRNNRTIALFSLGCFLNINLWLRNKWEDLWGRPVPVGGKIKDQLVALLVLCIINNTVICFSYK